MKICKTFTYVIHKNCAYQSKKGDCRIHCRYDVFELFQSNRLKILEKLTRNRKDVKIANLKKNRGPTTLRFGFEMSNIGCCNGK